MSHPSVQTSSSLSFYELFPPQFRTIFSLAISAFFYFCSFYSALSTLEDEMALFQITTLFVILTSSSLGPTGGALYCWGDNGWGQVGIGLASVSTNHPIAFSRGNNASVRKFDNFVKRKLRNYCVWASFKRSKQISSSSSRPDRYFCKDGASGP